MTKQFKSLIGEVSVAYEPVSRVKVKIVTSEDAHAELRPLFKQISYKEEAYMLLLNRANNTLGWVKLSEGGINGTIMDIRIILQHALLAHASNIILAHNHPSGNLKPSHEDMNVTKRIRESSRLMEVELLDHLIITSEGYTSLADEGRL